MGDVRTYVRIHTLSHHHETIKYGLKPQPHHRHTYVSNQYQNNVFVSIPAAHCVRLSLDAATEIIYSTHRSLAQTGIILLQVRSPTRPRALLIDIVVVQLLYTDRQYVVYLVLLYPTSRNHSAVQGLAPAIRRGALHQHSKQAALLPLLCDLSFSSYGRPGRVAMTTRTTMVFVVCCCCSCVWRRVASCTYAVLVVVYK